MGQDLCRACKDNNGSEEANKLENDLSNPMRELISNSKKEDKDNNPNYPLTIDNTYNESSVRGGRNPLTIDSGYENENSIDIRRSQSNFDANKFNLKGLSFPNNNQANQNISSIDQNILKSTEDVVTVDQDKIKEIIFNYRIKLIFNAFRKLKYLKEQAHQVVAQGNYQENSEEYLNYQTLESDLDVNLFPEAAHVYIGNIFNNKKDGYGLEVFPNQEARYFGRFLNGNRINIGKFSIHNDSKCYSYSGYIDNLYANDFGIYQDEDTQLKYVGQWSSSMRSGIGIEKYKDNSLYRGEFLNGKKHGVGEYKWMDNSWYAGEWSENILEGYGIYKFKDGSSYSGQWKNNKMDGLGDFTYQEQKTYFGYFKNDQRNGFGIVIWYNEPKAFVGYWKNNTQSGPGKFISNGKARFGVWKEGKMAEKSKSLADVKDQVEEWEEDFSFYFELEYEDLKERIRSLLI